MNVSSRGSILRPVIHLSKLPLPRWKVRAIEIGSLQSQRALNSKPASQGTVYRTHRPAVPFAFIRAILALALHQPVPKARR